MVSYPESGNFFLIMDWHSRSKRTSIPGPFASPTGASGAGGGSAGIYSSSSALSTGSTTPTSYTSPQQQQRSQFYSNYHPLLPPNLASASGTSGGSPTSTSGGNGGGNGAGNGFLSNAIPSISDRTLYYFSQYPLYCADWVYSKGAEIDCIALSSYKEGFQNKIQIIHGIPYNEYSDVGKNYMGDSNDDLMIGGSPTSMVNDGAIEGFDFQKVSEITVDYPVTSLQWDPSINQLNNGYNERIAASSEVLRLYKVDHEATDSNNEYKLVQTHVLANNSSTQASHSRSTSSNNNGTASSTSNSSSATSIASPVVKSPEEINKFPPVTSFDWNKLDSNIIITSSVDTTCTVWDLNRSYKINYSDSAQVKTQLIAHDLEVFDVKFIHNLTNIFASVGNDGSMRVFDLRSLEHLTIIYEPTTPPTTNIIPGGGQYNSTALIKLSTSNIDPNHLATIGVNSNEVIIIDMRMPGIPIAKLDGSLGGVNNAAINSIRWHPTSNYLLTGGDDCQALIWDCNNLTSSNYEKTRNEFIDTPILSYEEDLEVNNACWRRDLGDWMGVISGKGFQAVKI